MLKRILGSGFNFETHDKALNRDYFPVINLFYKRSGDIIENVFK